MMLAGWIPREQEAVVAYQKEEIERSERCSGGKGCASPLHSAAG